jgi:hypothetical protein
MARSNTMPEGNSGVTVHAGFSAVHYGGEGGFWRTVVTANTAFADIPGGANLGLGLRAISFPAGDVLVMATDMALALTQTQGFVTADTPDIGIGTTVASGVVTVLGGTAAFENMLTGQTATNCNGAVTNAFVNTALVIPTANSHDVFVNVADGWAASGDDALRLTGTVTILWAKVA